MAGDHKCPVCQSTFTRPQHVARHMRSHTGDRPYKCQHCGDAFARSDLLSRHVNKCHSAEKAAAQAAAEAAGLPLKGRKGRGNVSSKTPCDQCNLGKLQCNCGEPCAKCVAKGIKCTYNQMNIAKAHQLPSLTLSHTSSMRPRSSFDSMSSASSVSYPISDFGYGQPVLGSSTTDPLLTSLSSSLPPHFDFPSNFFGGSALDPHLSQTSLPLHDPRSGSPEHYSLNGSAGGIAAASREARADLLRRADPNHIPGYLYGSGPLPQGMPGARYPYKGADQSPPGRTIYTSDQQQPGQVPSHGNNRVTLPHLSSLPSAPPPQAYTSVATNALSELGTHNFAATGNDGRPQTSGEGAFSSAFGLMSLDDPAVLAGLAEHAPFFEGEGQALNRSISQASWANAGKDADKYRGGDAGYNDVRDVWSSLVRSPSDRTPQQRRNDPLLGVNPGHASSQTGNGDQIGQRPQMLHRRSTRRNSLPTIKTPPALMSDRGPPPAFPLIYPGAVYPGRDPERPSTGHSNLNTFVEQATDLKAYEEAVLARGGTNFRLDSSQIGPRRAKTLHHDHRRENSDEYDSNQKFRPVLPLGRNAPFIGPPQLTSQTGSVPPSSSSPSRYNPNEANLSSTGQPFHQLHPSRAGTWDLNPTAPTRPKPKRNASQTLEQELQKSLRPASDGRGVGGELDGLGPGYSSVPGAEEMSGLPPINNSPALSTTGSLSGSSVQSRPSSAVQATPAMRNSNVQDTFQLGNGTLHYNHSQASMSPRVPPPVPPITSMLRRTAHDAPIAHPPTLATYNRAEVPGV